MDAQPSLEQLAVELQRRGLPRAYINRFVAELRDHMDDVNTERSQDMSTARMPDVAEIQQRIGDPIQLAKFTAQQYHRRTFLGRHPILTFLFLPLPFVLVGVVVLFLVICLAMGAIAWSVDISPESRANPYVESLSLAAFCWLLSVVPPIATILLLCRLGRRDHLTWRWPITGCAIVAAFCAIFHFSYKLATNDHFIPDHPGNGQFMVGIMGFWGSSLKGWLTVILPKFAVAFGVGLLLVRRAQGLAVENQPPDKIELRHAA